MADKTSLNINVVGLNSKSRTSQVRFSDDQESKTDTTQTNTKTYINILLENSPSIIGFVIINGNNESLTLLSNLRKSINSQFDEDQLQILGNDTFKFLRNSIPISKKQENIINVAEIAISTESAETPIPTDTDTDINNIPNTTNDIIPSDNMYIHGGHITDSQRPTIRARLLPKKLASVRNISIEYIPNTAPMAPALATPNYEITPHHYQYLGGAAMPPPVHLAPSTPDLFEDKKLTQRSSTLLIPTDIENDDDCYYNVMVRTSANTFRYSPSYKSDEEQSIFGKFEEQNFQTLDYNNKTIRRSQLFHKKIDLKLAAVSSEMSLDDIKKENTASPKSESDAIETPRGPNQKTQLELQFGAVLPKIRANKSTKNVLVNKQISNILENARVNDEYDDEANSTKSSISNKRGMSKSLVEMMAKNINYTNIFDQETDYKLNNATSKMLLADKSIIEQISCRFTVIGSPHSTDDLRTQRTWQFYNPTELILGLQGVHHSQENPVWMDLVCDSDTFIMISEHVRPSIHGLTIEDCITRDCREKLEMFDHYLFCCIRTTSIDNEGESEKICIIIFKTMILTYHLGKTSDIIINDSRARLEKRHFGIKCPSPGWVAHTIIDVIVDRMIPEVECRVQEVQNIENLVFGLSGTSQYELLQRLQIARNWLVVYRSRLWPKSTMTHNFVNTDWRQTFLSGVQQQYWNDINDHVARMVDLLSLGQSTLESCQNIFIAKISLEMADQSNQLSDSAGRLTAVGSIFLPLSFFAGLWGMNCKVPFQYSGDDDDFWGDTYYGFIIVFLFMILSAIVTYKYATRFT